jgi:hypothetical protein
MTNYSFIGSHNVPLHEIPAAVLLPAEEFLAKYGFPLPDKKAKNTVLTCRYRGWYVVDNATNQIKIEIWIIAKSVRSENTDLHLYMLYRS